MRKIRDCLRGVDILRLPHETRMALTEAFFNGKRLNWCKSHPVHGLLERKTIRFSVVSSLF